MGDPRGYKEIITDWFTDSVDGYDVDLMPGLFLMCAWNLVLSLVVLAHVHGVFTAPAIARVNSEYGNVVEFVHFGRWGLYFAVVVNGYIAVSLARKYRKVLRSE